MKLTDLAAILRAASDRAEELAAEDERTRQERAEGRQTAKIDLVSADVEKLLELVAHRPGLSTGEILGSLQSCGLTFARARTALTCATAENRLIATRKGPHMTHFLASSEVQNG